MNENYRDVAYAESPYCTLSQYMGKSFGWMFAGLLVTFAVALATAFTGVYVYLFSTGLIFALTIAELVLVFVLSWRIEKLRPTTAAVLFFAYAVLNGVVFSVYFIAYQMSDLLLAFLVGSVYFGIMAVYGTRTEKDLSGWGPKLFGALIALIIVSVIGGILMMLGVMSFGIFDLIVCAVGLLIFMAFTAYDTQKLKYFYSYYGGDDAMLQKSAVIGALQLYLDYINIIIYVLRILSRSRRN